MLRTIVIVGLVSAVCAGVAVGLLVPVAVSRELPPANLPPRWPPQSQLVGATSCASAACHNQDVSGIHGREYAASLQDAAHRRAYSVLFGERSQRIVRNYYPELRDAKVVSPERDALCVKCHVHPDVARLPIAEVAGIRQFRLEDGVSCEACHGSAGSWIDRHYRPEWKTLSAAEKRDEFGMRDVRSIGGRVQTCVRCHVGTSDAEVNHDLIAAGHPRLAFEFTGYHALMPHHWDDRQDRDPAQGGRPDFEKQAWVEGQLLTLEASLDLLKHRQKTNRVELAEFDCYACHHDLALAGKKQDRTFSGRRPGELPWNTWNTCQLDDAARMLGVKNELPIGELRKQMQKMGPVDPALISRSLDDVRALIRVAQSRPPADFSAHDEMKSVQPKSPFGSWDEAAQYHNVVRALEQSRLDMDQPGIPGLRPGLVELRNALLPERRYRLPQVQDAADRIKKIVE